MEEIKKCIRFENCHIYEDSEDLKSIADNCEVLIKASTLRQLIRRAQPDNPPLTLDQLRKMDGKIVYFTPMNDWCKVTKYGLLFFGTEDYRSWEEIKAYYGKQCLAYASKPEEAQG